MKRLKTPLKKPRKAVKRVSSVKAQGRLTKAKMIDKKGIISVELPKGYKPGQDGAYWKKTDEGYLLTTRNEIDDLVDFLEKNPPPESMLTERPEQLPHQERKWWYEE